jgi:methionyl-tRNA formyltransferase
LLKIDNINEPIVIETLRDLQIDWLFIIGWSQIARKELLETPTNGCIGMHPTLLPIGRGRASIPWAILKGLDQTGVTLFKLDEGVDTGDIIGQGVIPLTPKTTATELYEQVNQMHIKLIGQYWDSIVNNTVHLQKQDESKATEWPGRKPEDGEILPSMTMEEADRLVRAVTHPYPGAFYKNTNGEIIKIWKACKNTKTGDVKLVDGYLRIYSNEDEL